MAITTSQQINKWYELYGTIDVTITKEIMKATGLDPRHVYLKCIGEQWPCVIFSTSFSSAKLIVSSKPAFTDKLKKANSLVSVRFSFRVEGKVDPVSFFISGHATGFSTYTQGGGGLQFMIVEYTQRPPDDLIDILGRVMEANMSAVKRKEERVLLNPESMRKIGLISKDTLIFVQGVPRKCIIRDLSFGGAKVIIVGIARFLVGKECILRMEMDDPRETLDIKGSIVRFEDVEGRKDLGAVAISFAEAGTFLSYKLHLNDYISQVRQSRGEDERAQAALAPAASAPAVVPAPAVIIAPAGATPGPTAKPVGVAKTAPNPPATGY
jgi:hypothetical protein